MNHDIFFLRSQLKDADNFRRTGKLVDAKNLLSRILEVAPNYYSALHTLGLVHSEMGNDDKAIYYLFRAYSINPINPETASLLSLLLSKVGARDTAIDTMLRVADFGPPNATTFYTLGKLYDQDKAHDVATQYFEKALRVEPGWKDAEIGLALSLASIGRTSEAESILWRLLDLARPSLSILSMLSEIPDAKFQRIYQSLKKITEPADDIEKSKYLFARACVERQIGKSDAAWSNAEAANAIRYKLYAKQIDQNNRLESDTLSLTLKTGGEVKRDENLPTSLFILGPSRSGKTTLERFLVGDGGGIKRYYEASPTRRALSLTMQKHGFASTHQFKFLPVELESNFISEYSRILNGSCNGASIVTSTLPPTVHEAWRLITLVPNAKFVFVFRDLVDSIVSIFFRDFASGNFYAYSVDTILKHLMWYREVANALVARFPNSVTIVSYENMKINPQLVNDALAGLNLHNMNLCVTEPDFDVGVGLEFHAKIKQALPDLSDLVSANNADGKIDNGIY